MAHSIKTTGNNALEIIFKTKEILKGGHNYTRTFTIVNEEPSITMPVRNFSRTMSEYDKFYIYGIDTGRRELPVKGDPDVKLGDILFKEFKRLVRSGEESLLQQCSHLIYENNIVLSQTEERTNVYVFPLSEALIKAINNGSIKQEVHHETNVVTTA